MKVYLDIIFLINFLFDSILLFTVSIMLRRNIKLRRIILGGIVGGLSTFTLFFKVNNLELFIIKFIISVLMILLTFKFKNLKYTLKNLAFLYMTSMVLGGFLYFLNCEFAYKKEGLIFYHNGLSINFIVLVIISPLILYTYIKQGQELKNTYSYYYKINIYLKNKIIKANAFLDTGNRLKDPYLNRPIIIINQKMINEKEISDFILVPMDTINKHTLLKCIKVDKIDIEGIGEKTNILIGVSPNKIKMEGIDCILGQSVLEG